MGYEDTLIRAITLCRGEGDSFKDTALAVCSLVCSMCLITMMGMCLAASQTLVGSQGTVMWCMALSAMEVQPSSLRARLCTLTLVSTKEAQELRAWSRTTS